MAVVNIVNGKTLTGEEYKAHLQRCREANKAAGTDIASGRLLGRSGNSGWPMFSSALGCHPGQEQEMYEHSVQIGVPTEFVRGKCKLNDAGHRARYLKANRIHDKDGGYRET